MSKGSRNRTADHKAFRENAERIFKRPECCVCGKSVDDFGFWHNKKTYCLQHARRAIKGKA